MQTDEKDQKNTLEAVTTTKKEPHNCTIPTNSTTFQVPCVLNVFSLGFLQTWQRRIIDHEAFMYHFYVKLENCQQKRDYTDMKV